jgi:hypothetical protein
VETSARANTHMVGSDLASRRAAEMATLADRIQLLRSLLPAMAGDLAAARREIQRLRRENARLEQLVSRDPVVSTGRR